MTGWVLSIEGTAQGHQITIALVLLSALLHAIFRAYLSFGGVILATRLDSVGQAAVLRETSTVFAALIGWLMLKEKVTMPRLMLMALIALGAVIVGVNG